jgi:hypothetical protein
VRGRTVLFAGFDHATYRDVSDTWEWDGTQWFNRSTPSSPTRRSEHALAYDAARRRVVVFGGTSDDTWEWDGTTWSFVSTPSAPPSRLQASMTYDAARAETIVYGGIRTSVVGDHDDVWAFRWEAPGADEACLYGVDTDGDGLVGCDDDDCWAYCDPLCVPGLTAAECASDAPRCGDGACSAIETCRLCPEDCGACEPVCGDHLCDDGEACAGDCAP